MLPNVSSSSRPFIEPRLQPSPQPLHYPPNCSPVPPNYSPAPPPMQRFAPDNISIKSAPTLTRSTSGSHVCASPPTARPRAKKWPRGHAHYRLSSSASTSSLSSTTSTISRPKSYVPFEGWVETPATPPGWAARDILHSLSYAPTHDSFGNFREHSSSDFSPLFSIYKKWH